MNRAHRPRNARLFPLLPLLLLACSLVPACGGGGGAAGPSDMALAPPDLAYPGPTGPNIGDIVPDFEFQGYWSPGRTSGLASTNAWGKVDFDMMRNSGSKYAIVQTAAIWCGPCLLNAKTLTARGTPLIPQGLLLSLVMTDGNPPGRRATQAQIDSWIANVKQPFTTFNDSEAPQPPFNDYWGIERDHFLIIDLRTMKLIDIVEADPVKAIDEVTPLLTQ